MSTRRQPSPNRSLLWAAIGLAVIGVIVIAFSAAR